MQSTIRRFIGPVIAISAGSGLEVSGYENLVLAIALWSVAGVWCIVALVTLPKLGIFSVKNKNLEIGINPSKYLDDSPFYSIAPGHSITAIFGLVLLNHSTEQKANIASAHLILRTRKWVIGKTNLFSVPLEIQSHPNDYPLKDIVLEPQSKTEELPISVHGLIPVISSFPRKSELVLVLEMVGPTRRVEHILEKIKHDPKRVPDIPDWKRQ